MTPRGTHCGSVTRNTFLTLNKVSGFLQRMGLFGSEMCIWKDACRWLGATVQGKGAVALPGQGDCTICVG